MAEEIQMKFGPLHLTAIDIPASGDLERLDYSVPKVAGGENRATLCGSRAGAHARPAALAALLALAVGEAIREVHPRVAGSRRARRRALSEMLKDEAQRRRPGCGNALYRRTPRFS